MVLLKFLISVFVIVMLSACGVETSSSSAQSPSLDIVDPGNDDTTDSDDCNTTDPDDGNTTDPDDGNTTDPDDGNTTDPDDGNTDSGEPDTIFDYEDAIEDPNACTNVGYRVASDASFNGNGTGENGADSFVIVGQGLVIRSEYYAQTNDDTWVNLYYKGFPTVENLNLQGITSYKMDNVFFISYDLAWADESIPDIDNTMYVQSNKGEKPVCYRLDLNSTVGTQIGVQKVYRLSL